MRRLALVAGVDVDHSSSGGSARQPGIGTYFGLGLAGGAAAGIAAMLALYLTGMTPIIKVGVLAGSWLSLTPPISTPAVASPPVSGQDVQVDAFDMRLERAAGASAPFGLRVVGRAEGFAGVVMHNLPPAARFSHGERRDATTWAVGIAHLPDLHITLPEAAPDAFDVRIDVMTPSAIAAATSIARVRVVNLPGAPSNDPVPPPAPVASLPIPAATETPVVKRATAATTRTEARPDRPAASPAATAAAATIVHAPAASHRQAAPVQAGEAEQRHWPEGASGLGAIPRATERQVWWTLPVPAWSPFLDSTGR